jgi:hypothetical protein
MKNQYKNTGLAYIAFMALLFLLISALVAHDFLFLDAKAVKTASRIVSI